MTQGHSCVRNLRREVFVPGPTAATWAAVLMVAFAACTGAIQSGGPLDDNVAPGPSSPGGGAAGGGSPKTPGSQAQPPTPGALPAPSVPGDRPVSQTCKAIEPGPTLIRRLTRLEYNNTVRDLLGTISQPANVFPPETVVHSFDNEAASLTASPVLIEEYLGAAERVATDAVDNRLIATLGCDPAKDGEDACAGKFFENFGKRAYRRPLTAEDRTILTDVYNAGKVNGGFKGGIRLSLATMLASVHFLYRVEFGAPPKAGETVTSLTPWELATRLSYLIWRSMPDTNLLAAAEANKLTTRTEVDAQITRMLADPKARDTVADFYEQWLRLRGIETITKDPMVYPAFHSDTAGLMKQETLKFVDSVVWDGDGSLAQLYTAPFTFVNTALAKYYGLPAPAGAGFGKVSGDTQARAGLLTQGGLMSVLAQENQTHPIRRGTFVRKDLLCQTLLPPPDGIKIEFPPVNATLTGRERFVQHRADPLCATCHTLIDPIGFGFENFDGIGQFRRKENGKDIDVSGEVVGLAGGGQFNGAAELGGLLARSEEAASCVVVAWFRYGYGRDLAGDADACSMDMLKRAFTASKFKITDLITTLARTDAFQFRRVITPGGLQ